MKTKNNPIVADKTKPPAKKLDLSVEVLEGAELIVKTGLRAGRGVHAD